MSITEFIDSAPLVLRYFLRHCSLGPSYLDNIRGKGTYPRGILWLIWTKYLNPHRISHDTVILVNDESDVLNVRVHGPRL